MIGAVLPTQAARLHTKITLHTKIARQGRGAVEEGAARIVRDALADSLKQGVHILRARLQQRLQVLAVQDGSGFPI
jgi:hypothetical protein